MFCLYKRVEQLGGFKLPFISLGSLLLLVGFISYFVLPSQHGKLFHFDTSLSSNDQQGRNHVSKILGVHCPSFLSVPTNVQLRSKASMGEERVGVMGCSPPQPTIGSGAESLPQTILGHFMCNFMRFYSSFSAFNGCLEMRDS